MLDNDKAERDLLGGGNSKGRMYTPGPLTEELPSYSASLRRQSVRKTEILDEREVPVQLEEFPLQQAQVSDSKCSFSLSAS